MLPLPAFYEPDDVKTVRLERAGLVADAALAYRARHGIPAAERDEVRIAALGIDAQIGFCSPEASLFVPGAVEDTQRALAWLYRNADKLTQLVFSLDTHRVFQIFHPAFWRDERGAPPAPFTTITPDDVRSGRYRPIQDAAACLEYVERLEATGKYVLTVWPYHTLLGGVSHALVPALMEAAVFHAVLRTAPTHFATKGMHTLTENYSVLAPEVRELAGRPIAGSDDALLRLLLSFDRVYVFGQAKSHCVLATLRDLQARIAAVDAGLLAKIWILEDATSPVSPPPLDPLPPALDFPRIAEEAFRELARAGMRLVRTTDPIVL